MHTGTGKYRILAEVGPGENISNLMFELYWLRFPFNEDTVGDSIIFFDSIFIVIRDA